MAAASESREPWASNQVRIGVLVLVVILVIGLGVGLYFALHTSGKHKPKNVAARIGPITYTYPELRAEAFTLKTPIYWAGARAGYHYEFTRATTGFLYLRYLPQGVPVGAPGSNFLVVSTYPFTGAFASLKKLAGKKALQGPGGSVIYVRPKKTNILMAFPAADFEIEIYDPQPAIALATAQSGKIKPVPRH